jgi:hypothetical protein
VGAPFPCIVIEANGYFEILDNKKFLLNYTELTTKPNAAGDTISGLGIQMVAKDLAYVWDAQTLPIVKELKCHEIDDIIEIEDKFVPVLLLMAG